MASVTLLELAPVKQECVVQAVSYKKTLLLTKAVIIPHQQLAGSDK
jgi:hypothetical protein